MISREFDPRLADYVVLRPCPNIDAAEIPEELLGAWLDRSSVPKGEPINDVPEVTFSERNAYVAKPSGQFEENAAGRVAEVWLIHSCGPICG